MGKFIWLGFQETVENFPQGTGIIMGRNLRSHKPVKEDRTATTNEKEKKTTKK